ncbi:MAG: hypothetical protein HDS16_05005 [Bacteroides sp.]|nr:hypothetical protein [Bacteroides sp.]
MQYIKTPKELTKDMGLGHSRPKFPDGNYLLWDRDFLRFGSSDTFGTLIPALGCRVLTPEEVRAEQDGGEAHELPEATDERVTHLFPAKNTDKPSEPEKGDMQ